MAGTLRSTGGNNLNTPYNSTENYVGLSAQNTTDSDIIAAVQLYTVLLVFLLFLTVAVLGALANVALLVSVKCKRSIRNFHYVLPFSLSATNVAMCVIWMLAHTIQMVQNHSGSSAWHAVCYLNITAFHVTLGAIVFTTVSIAIQRMYRLCQHSSDGIPCLIISALCVTWMLSLVAALAMVLEYHKTWDYAICFHGALYANDSYTHSTVAVVISLIYVLVLFITLIATVIITLRQRRHLAVLLLKGTSDCQLSSKGHNADRGYRKDNKHGDTSHPGSSSNHPSTADNGQDHTFIAEQETFRPSRVKIQETEEDDDDNDTFDMNMRKRWQKTSSGRRHTVANIGIRDTLFGPRRGSLDGPKPASSNYQYVRKWSVDIVALQDQLENPKLGGSRNPFTRLAILNERDKMDPEADVEQQPQQAESKKDVASEPEPTVEDKLTSPTTEFDSKQEDEIEDINDSTEPLQSTEPILTFVYGNQHGNQAGYQGNATQDDIHHLQKELARCSKYMVLLLVTLFCVSPYAVVQILQVSMGAQTNRNISYFLAALCLVQCPLHPLILAWLDTRLSSALSRLHNKLTHWRCVCYCNIGKGKRCLGRHRKPNIAEDFPDA